MILLLSREIKIYQKFIKEHSLKMNGIGDSILGSFSVTDHFPECPEPFFSFNYANQSFGRDSNLDCLLAFNLFRLVLKLFCFKLSLSKLFIVKRMRLPVKNVES